VSPSSNSESQRGAPQGPSAADSAGVRSREPAQRTREVPAIAELRFLADGRERALDGAASKIDELQRHITAEVEAQYAEKLAKAAFFERFWLRRRIAREIQARLRDEIEKSAPENGLYLQKLQE
jgi:hypothetical protein